MKLSSRSSGIGRSGRDSVESAAINWLLEESSTAVRYRTLTELLDNDCSAEAEAALDALLSSEDVKHAFSLFEIEK